MESAGRTRTAGANSNAAAGPGRCSTTTAESGVGCRRATAARGTFPAPPPRTGHEVLPHPALHRAVERPHSAVPTRWRTSLASYEPAGPDLEHRTGNGHAPGTASP